MSGLRRATIEKRILEAALEHAAVDRQARERFQERGRYDPATRQARYYRRELRLRLARLGRLLRHRLDEEEEKRQEAEDEADWKERLEWQSV